jgi:phosphoglycolate phosphatase-like HAD superfamily hydrolase
MGNQSGISGGLLQDDDVSEALELGDEAADLLGGSKAGEVVAAGVLVDLAGGEQVQVPAGGR